MADKGQGQVKRFLLGSTSDRVVRHADTSVLIIK
jgi:nucleotide-binding universal stress UspA family protein